MFLLKLVYVHHILFPTISDIQACVLQIEINQYSITMATHYDITMGNDVARDIHCDVTISNDVYI